MLPINAKTLQYKDILPIGNWNKSAGGNSRRHVSVSGINNLRYGAHIMGSVKLWLLFMWGFRPLTEHETDYCKPSFSSEFVSFRLASLLFCESWFFTSLSSSPRAEGWGLTSHCWSTYCGLAHTTGLSDCAVTQGAAGPRKTPRKYQSAPSHIIVHRCQARTGGTHLCVCVVHTGQKWCIKVYNPHCVVRGSLSSHS